MDEPVTILSSVCGKHFDEDCRACASAKQSNDDRLEASGLSARIAVLEGLVEASYREGWHEGYATGDSGGRIRLDDDWELSNARVALHG